MPRDTDDEIAEANWLARKARNASRCQCDDLPLYCPGPANCPYSGAGDDEPEETETDDDGPA